MKLVSLEQASNHLRRDTTDDDTDLELKVEAASAAVITYIDDEDFLRDSNGEYEMDSDDVVADVPAVVQAATLLMVGELYLAREGRFADTAPGRLPPAVESLLYPLKNLSVA